MRYRDTERNERRTLASDPDRLLNKRPRPPEVEKVLFGACAGVRKAQAMLAQSAATAAQGLDVVIVVETLLAVKKEPPRYLTG